MLDEINKGPIQQYMHHPTNEKDLRKYQRLANDLVHFDLAKSITSQQDRQVQTNAVKV